MERRRLTWVVDTGPLSHFAKAGWLGVLKMLAPDHRIVIPDTVERELRRQRDSLSYAAFTLEQSWIEVVSVVGQAELEAFARYHRRLVGDSDRNVGECGVLALAEVRHWTAVIDDAEAVKAARSTPSGEVRVLRTLRLLFDAVRDGHLDARVVSTLCDDLAASQYRVPFEPGGALRWASDNGLI